jgi:hypothetical protein
MPVVEKPLLTDELVEVVSRMIGQTGQGGGTD